ncbi:hypothetical protein Dip510_001710 [Elusimicrobium posterum]|uniref:DUF6794 domain-containing protein n=1 Tax=Elusimicrobium posterum TaxID=3116653 RepID=UPI003C77B1A1
MKKTILSLLFLFSLTCVFAQDKDIVTVPHKTAPEKGTEPAQAEPSAQRIKEFEETFGDIVVPQDLEAAVVALANQLDDEAKKEYKAMPRYEASVNAHMSTGMWIRNAWIRNPKDKTLSQYFTDREVRQPDDMSSMILNGLWLYLHNEPYTFINVVEFEGKQSQYYREKAKAKREAEEAEKNKGKKTKTPVVVPEGVG